MKKIIAKIKGWKICKSCQGFMVPIKGFYVLTDKWQSDYRCVECKAYWSSQSFPKVKEP